MKLIDLLTSPWALQPEKLVELQAIYATHLRGDKIDLAAVEARLGRPLANEQQAYEIRTGGIAVLPVEGVIAPKANLFTRVSGGTSTQQLTLQVESAIADPRVRALVLAIDSPGGSVFGTPELAAAIFELGQSKPIVSVSDGTIASAAYWIGSAANAVFVSGPTVHAGSIGVVATHDYAPRGPGAKTTEITAGKYKRIASSTEPLTDAGREYIQAQVDHIYRVFVDAVAQHRGVDADTVLERMADGRVFIGQQALAAGLVDGVATVDAMVERLAADPREFAKRRKAFAAAAASPSPSAAAHEDTPAGANAGPTPEKGTVMPQADTPPLTRESLERDHAALFAQVRSEFTTLGATQERERIQAVRAQTLPGHEALIDQLAFDGQTSGPEAAAAVLAAERSLRQAAVQAHHRDAPAPAPASAAPNDTQAEPSSRDLAKGVLALFHGTRGASAQGAAQ
jgi:signal peptide peptidase SppA